MEKQTRRPTTQEIDDVYNQLTGIPQTARYVSEQLGMNYALAEDILGHMAAFGVAKEDVRSSLPTYRLADISAEARKKKLDFMKNVAQPKSRESSLSDSDLAEIQRWLEG